MELKTYKCENDYIFEYDTLYDSDSDISIVEEPDDTEDARKKRLAHRAESDTIIVPAQEEGFQNVFLGEARWYAIRIGAAMKDRIKYIAAYQVAPESAVTYIAEVKDIIPYEDSGKYLVEFKSSAEKLAKKIKIRESKNSPQGPIYVKREDLLKVDFLEDALHI